MNGELPKAYEHKETEDKIYQLWLRAGFFNPDKLPGTRKKSYAIVIPPPNVTGELHMGHALNATCQDILIRKKRMEGFRTLWLPGTDHAGIATQVKVEKELRKQEGISRHDLGREKFIEKIWEWKNKYGDIILDQLKRLGASCDWSRTRFTLDEEYVKAVENAFLHYYEKGWIYRGERVVNWCPRCRTSLSDLELEYKEEKGKLWYIKYPIKKISSLKSQILNYITVATTRPETMLGDMAVAVSPKDKRYKNFVGGTVILPIQNREIPIIEDSAVDVKFGTGAVKVTPAHDLTDWEIGQRHKLESLKVIDEGGKMTKESKICEGSNPLQCREIVIEELEKKNLIEKTEDFIHSVPYCYRCHSLIEPIPSKQWFLKMDKLAKMALKAVKSGKVKFIPKNFEKVYFDWLKNIKDWCISRQIWWGHKIPIEGENDVLDTWFSSALWPFATLGWPEKKEDLKNFYPTDVLSTARDIINLWVARMIFSGMEFMGKTPFHSVFIHPTVLTKEGERMSKSLGTGIDPLNLCEKYGADATRFGIAWQLMGGQDIKFTEDNIVMGRKFCNKIWNASRYVLMQIPKSEQQITSKLQIPKSEFTEADKKIVKALDKTIKSVNKSLQDFQFGQAAHNLYDFFWHDFCDIYIEKSKEQNDEKTKKILLFVLSNSLKILHPFIPFITEEIYQTLPIKDKKQCLMVESWPQ
ncbi:MAG: valine--tRNA ligase [Candidatus Nealsonbacteria bacterium CG02_land_8_20_14_3_00_40_11]|uniref:Valine--tRNA ligase n=1 Tax=Candidatus Nealsonbacteria bacterium CG02_land_8_20_14_3_00_40_11 TaxID=1974700 RepID=A0A2M7D846_9BACT|nr:MAG: valine--tRNA ligase [Candidatus Nealsonbacteria bacterium CG02_land_8_20_14_3_00_40_11]